MRRQQAVSAGIFGAEARSEGKRARTRARLMDAAVEVFARRGVERASANEIAQAADVSNGTFYNHFRDKDDIVTAVAFRIAGDVVRRVDEAMAGLDDAAERVAFGTRQIVELGASQAEWGHALVRSIGYLPDLRRRAAAYARADIERGVARGTFDVEVDDFLMDLFVALVMTALDLRLRGEAGPEAGPKVAEAQLRMLGVPAARARELARRELAPLRFALAERSAREAERPARGAAR
jgi:AcrR family transcriptional regulator